MFKRPTAICTLAVALLLLLSACMSGTATVDVEATVQARIKTREKETSLAQTQNTVEALATSVPATQTALSATQTQSAAEALATSVAATQKALATPTSTSVPSTTPTFAATQTPQVVTRIITATPLPSTATPSPTPTKTVPLATSTPSSAPFLIEPKDRSSFSEKQPVTLTWTWIRPLEENEFFEIQLAGWRTSPAVQDWNCTKESKYTIPSPPIDLGYYSWRIVVRKGIINNSGCVSQGDVSLPSVIWGFDWRGEGGGGSVATPESKPYP